MTPEAGKTLRAHLRTLRAHVSSLARALAAASIDGRGTEGHAKVALYHLGAIEVETRQLRAHLGGK